MTTTARRSKLQYDVDMICRRLKLSKNVSIAMKTDNPGNEYMASVLSGEVAYRDETRAARLINAAKFPQHKVFEGYDFSKLCFPDEVTREYFLDGIFIDDKRGLFLYGSPGTGKTHFAIADGIRACERGLKVRFWRGYDLCEALRKAASRNEFAKFQAPFKKLDLLIIDEFGFYPGNHEAIRLLFELFCSSVYQKTAFIMTSNLNYDEWIENAEEPKVADAIIDRINGVSHVISFTGESKRFEQSAMTRA